MADELVMNAQPQTQEPVKTVTENLAPPMDDATVRRMVMEAEKAGEDVAGATSAQTFPQGVTDPLAAAPAAPPDVPAKFLKPDGSVDVDKLKTSTEQLNEGIQQKQQVQEKTVEDYIREYKEKERQFHSMPSNPDVIRRQLDSQAAPIPAPPPAQPVGAVPPPQLPDNDLAALRQKIAEDLRVDPVGTIVDLVKAVSQKELEPFNREREERAQAARDESIRRNLAEIAATDRRILDPQVFQAVTQELNQDPGYRNLRNPHLAAWAVVKERMRLGVAQPAQPSRPPSPILGGGTPPPAPSASGAVTPRALMGAIPQAKNPQELAALEQQIRGMIAQLD